MQYSVELVTPSTQQEMIDFLKEHENFCLFLLNNFENFGPILTDAPFSGNFKLVRSNDQIVGVFCLAKRGNLLIESVAGEPIFDLVLEACQQEPVPLKGIVGSWDFAIRFWEYLKAKKIILKEEFSSKEVLYTVDLQQSRSTPQANVRLLSKEDFEQWKTLNDGYYIEMGFNNDLSDQQVLDLYHQKVRKKYIWGFFHNTILSSTADFNAKALDLGQVGGVYTLPEFRNKGHSKAVMRQLLTDARELHSIRKLIIFTGQNNLPAQKVYLSLGALQVGHFALLFGQQQDPCK